MTGYSEQCNGRASEVLAATLRADNEATKLGLSKATRKAGTILILALAPFGIVALSIRIVTLRDAIE